MNIFGEPRTKADIIKHEKLFLWGAGFACTMTVNCFGKEKVNGIFDNDERKWGEKLCGIDIISPQKLEEYKNDDYVIVISTNGYEYEIAEGIKEKWNVPQDRIYCNSNDILEECRYLPRIIEENMDRIFAVKEMLADNDSKEFYMNFIKACYNRNPFLFRDNKSAVDAYEYATDMASVGLKGGETILDCGAFIGDTARLFMGKTKNNCKIYCFEPVVENCKEMEKWIKEEKIDNVFVHNVGVGEKKHKDYVYSNEEVTTMGAVGDNRFRADNPVVNEILVDTIDNLAEGIAVDYIKMDIEGAEMAAIRGGKNTILKNKPQMLISGYHRIADMWEIPEYVIGLCSEYKIFLGHQPHAPFEPEFMFVR